MSVFSTAFLAPQTVIDARQFIPAEACIRLLHRNVKPQTREVVTMYVDEYVIAGLIIVALTCSFFVGVYRFIKKDMEKHSHDAQ